jgi:TetR/AcrR family transcriptional regulator, transcriptional repressor for nem operon
MKEAIAESKTKEALLNAAQQLMLEKGFVATTVDEICAEADVTKGSFFYYFKTKDELGKILLNRFTQQTGSRIMAVVAAAGEDPRDRVYGFVDAAMEMADCCDTKGCLVGTFAQEVSESHPQLRVCCEEAFLQMRKAFELELKKAKEKYAKNDSMDTKGLSEHFLALVQGSFLLMKATRDRSLMTRTLLHFKSYLEQLFGK